MMRILIVEDDQYFCRYLCNLLTKHRYTVDYVSRAKEALDMLELTYDLLILDISLPDINGIDLCKKIRNKGNSIPILMLTSSNYQTIEGLDSGADEYIAKACDVDELLARIRALLHRGNLTLQPLLTWGLLSLDPATNRITYRDKEIKFRPKEYQLLELFLRYPKRIFSRDSIIDHLWSLEEPPSKHAVTNLIKDTRRRLQLAGVEQELFETVYGVGYRLRELSNKATDDSFSAIQEQFLSTLDHKIKLLGEVITLKQSNKLTPDRELEGQQIAHQLAGSLGTFGFPDATPIARSIELILKSIDTPEDNLPKLFNTLQIIVSKSPLKLGFQDHNFIQSLVLITNNLDYADRFYAASLYSNFRLDVVEPHEISKITSANLIIVYLETDEHLQILANVRASYPTPLIVVDCQLPSLSRRLEIANYLPDRYCTSNLPEEILSLAKELLSPKINHKILILINDHELETLILNLLQNELIEVLRIGDKNNLFETLNEAKADLLILEDSSSIELCQIIRQDVNHAKLAILSITNQSESIVKLFSAGSDDVLLKSVVRIELIPRLLSQLKRSRMRHL